MKFEKYKFKEYDLKYKRLFQLEKGRLKKIFPNAKIEHIGSTAVEGLGGKGIIDINLGVKKSEVKKAIEKLNENNYRQINTPGSGKERWFFEKDRIYKGKTERFHIHLTIINSDTWKKCILFRDALRNNKKLREEYSEIKKKAMRNNLKDEEYKNYKNKLIQRVLKNVK